MLIQLHSRQFEAFKYYLLLITSILVFSACSHPQGKFVINGAVPDEIFWGEKVYLVALDGPISQKVDSTIVQHGAFSFVIPADSLDVRVLRMAAKLPHMIEDLVVVAEEGVLNVNLDVKSSGKGTPLNNRLQIWKESKTMHDSIQRVTSLKLRSEAITPIQSDSLINLSKEMRAAFNDESTCFLLENKHNGIGLLLFKLFHQSLEANVKNQVLQATGNLYFERDAQLKQMFFPEL